MASIIQGEEKVVDIEEEVCWDEDGGVFVCFCFCFVFFFVGFFVDVFLMFFIFCIFF